MVARAGNPLLECCATLFALTAPFRRADGGAGLPGDHGTRLVDAFDELERLAFERQLPARAVRDAKYAMAAYVDEMVLSSRWEGRRQWMQQPLQVMFFGDHLAGEGFYARLAELRQGGEECLDLLELYYVCLQLGFEGVYRLRGLEQLMALMVDLRDQIESRRGTPDPGLAPAAIPREGVFAQARREVPLWVIGVLATGLVVFPWIGYRLAADHVAERAVGRLAAVQASLATAGEPRP